MKNGIEEVSGARAGERGAALVTAMLVAMLLLMLLGELIRRRRSGRVVPAPAG